MHSLGPCITVPMAVIGNGLGILGWANNGGRGWTSTGVMWETCMRSLSCLLICDYFAMMIRSQLEKKKFLTGIVAERQVFMLENYLKGTTWTSVFWDHLGDCCNFISHGILQFMPDFLHLPYKLCQMQPPFSASVWLSYVQTRGIENKCSLCPVPTSMHDSLKTSEPCSRCQWEHQKKPACDWKCDPSYQPNFPTEGNEHTNSRTVS